MKKRKCTKMYNALQGKLNPGSTAVGRCVVNADKNG
jgi:hypothetical protein